MGISYLASTNWTSALTMPTYKFYNTRLSDKVQHGFHALALDEMGVLSTQLSGRGGHKVRTYPIFDKSSSPELMTILAADIHIRVLLISHSPDDGSNLVIRLRVLTYAIETLFEVPVKYYKNRELESTIAKHTDTSASHI
ncbi:hypothetical protein HD806DRAFT_476114 [Xylariaceae sp. AK1471]|nr:hypothetical protein HD806DRAFT_476114 [Xylariaceae sp. AK1471]